MAREDRFYSYDDGEDEEDNEDNDDKDYHRDDDDDDDEVATPNSTATQDAKKLNMKMTLSKRG